MPKKCESCRFFFPLSGGTFTQAKCLNEDVRKRRTEQLQGFTTITRARTICDRDGDGIFVYFEPHDPAAGAAFAVRRFLLMR